jgi:hypothetical protein
MAIFATFVNVWMLGSVGFAEVVVSCDPVGSLQVKRMEGQIYMRKKKKHKQQLLRRQEALEFCFGRQNTKKSSSEARNRGKSLNCTQSSRPGKYASTVMELSNLRV